MKIKELLQMAVNKLNDNKIEEPILKARLLLAHILKVEKEYILIHDEEVVDTIKIAEYEEGVQKLASHIPLQHITHHQEFMKLDFYVDENVLIPRPDTEMLVEEVINFCNKNTEKKYKILDLCTGSGAIGISIANYVKNSQVICVDISEKALEVAKKNAKLNNINNIEFVKSDMFENVASKFDLIVSNPPYIKKQIVQTLSKEVQKEPIIALDGGEDGLNFYKTIINNTYDYAYNNGMLFLEIGYDQKEDVTNLLEESKKYKDIYSKTDLSGNDRIIVAKIKHECEV